MGNTERVLRARIQAVDNFTQEEISKLCGNKSAGIPLITKEEIKLLQVFEAIVLFPRMLPIKTKFVPDYKIPWNITEEKKQQPKREEKTYEIYDLKKYI